MWIAGNFDFDFDHSEFLGDFLWTIRLINFSYFRPRYTFHDVLFQLTQNIMKTRKRTHWLTEIEEFLFSLNENQTKSIEIEIELTLLRILIDLGTCNHTLFMDFSIKKIDSLNFFIVNKCCTILLRSTIRDNALFSPKKIDVWRLILWLA